MSRSAEGREAASFENKSTSVFSAKCCEADVADYVLALQKEVNDALERRVRFSSDCPKRLADAMRYSLLAPGKRFRPVLALVATELCGGSRATAMPACVALEAVHTYSLIHDDLPAMDDDDLRRGRPTCHRKFDEATAILAGDALLTFAFEVLATDFTSAEIASRCVATLARAAGPTGMVGGQVDDVLWASTLKNGVGAYDLICETLATAASEPKGDSDELGDPGRLGLAAFLSKIHRRKTGALIVAAVRLGALVANADSHRLEVLASYACELGLAFQIADDLLDVAGNEEQTGKRVGKDGAEGKLTYPSLYGVETTRDMLDATVSRAKDALISASDIFDAQSIAFRTALFLADCVARRDK
ncbi:MAG: polyprenyl synthetase family protein [Thermoguttaceae bacterium]|jgi:geranylgeranyl diphosphate synthase type II